MDDTIPEVPLALVSSAYLDKKTAQIRQKSILWEGYERAHLLTRAHVELIKSIDKKTPDQVQAAVQDRGEDYSRLILHLIQHLTTPETTPYVCILIDNILSDHDENARYFHAVTLDNPEALFGPFFRVMSLNDETTSLLVSKILTTLACSAPSPSSLDLSPLWQWIAAQLASPKAEVVDITIQEVQSLLRVRQFRIPFWKTNGAVKELLRNLQTTTTPQMQYQIIFCLWLLTFDECIAREINARYDIVPLLVDIAKGALKEKVIRVSIATLKNLVEKAPAENLAAMLVVKLLPFSENLSARKWSDTDMVEDIDYLKEKLQDNFKSLTTFEQYASEIETGKLEWSPPHKSETFWKDNASRLEEDNFNLLRQLARILSTATNPLILSVAANDIGQYIKYASKNGKRVLQDIGAKQRTMELMTHEDQDVRYHALSAVQKYMHQTWEI